MSFHRTFTDEALIAIPEASTRLGIRESTLRHWVAERRIEFVKVGRGIRFRPQVIRSYIASRTEKEVERG